MKRTFVVYNDPGHGWAKVPFDVIDEIGMKLEDFSSYSYLKRRHIYLEEDCDMSLFAKRFNEHHGVAPAWRDRHCNNESKIRHYWGNCPLGQKYARLDLI